MSEYWGDTGRSAYHRFKKQQEEVVKKDDGNADDLVITSKIEKEMKKVYQAEQLRNTLLPCDLF